jgi:Protein of unknown function (DUF1311).
MAKQKSKIEEIIEVRSRQHYGTALFELRMRLLNLENEFDQVSDNSSELFRYFTVAIIACAESFFRLAIKELIDSGEPFLSNAENLRDTVKFDFTVLRAIHGKSVTVGDFVSHCVALSSLEHINTTLSIILGVDFLDSVKDVADRWVYEVLKKPKVPIIEEPNKVFAGVKRTFEMRHIICHEFASNVVISKEDVSDSFKHTATFLRASAEFIQEIRYPGAPLTQYAMNINSAKLLDERREILNVCCAEVKARLNPGRILEFDAAQQKWADYCDAWARFEADVEAGGTIRPLLYGNVARKMTEQRIEEVKSCTGGDLS